MNNKKVVIGMSGGVDSSVSAYLLKEMGYDVIGVTMRLSSGKFGENDSPDGCCSLKSVEDARRVAEKIDIPYYVLNFSEVFEKRVINYFVDEYSNGRTPNPCIYCNKFIKFEELLKRAFELDANYVATGHYAKIEKTESGRYALRRSEDEGKDQTYVLYNLTQFQLEHTLMPIGDFHKSYVREIAEKIGLSVAKKPDSEEICFIPDDNYGKFLSTYFPKTEIPGDFIDKHGNVLGKHNGIIHYTIGQRKGLGISFGKKVFVTGIDTQNNSVILGDQEDLFKNTFYIKDVNFISVDNIYKKTKVKCKIRYAANEEDAYIYPEENGLYRIDFDKPQRAITPGQSAVIYDEDYVVGGGIIFKVE